MIDELSACQTTELEKDLITLKMELESLLHVTEKSAAPVLLKENAGMLSRMADMHNQSILLANRNVTKGRIKLVILAQARMKDDNYGFCTTCDDLIAFNRLKAYPEANMCLTCKSKSEIV